MARQEGVSGLSQVLALLSPVFLFINMLVIANQAWLTMKPPGLMMRIEMVL